MARDKFELTIRVPSEFPYFEVQNALIIIMFGESGHLGATIELTIRVPNEFRDFEMQYAFIIVMFGESGPPRGHH